MLGPKTKRALGQYQDAQATLKSSGSPSLLVANAVPASIVTTAPKKNPTPWMDVALGEVGVAEIPGAKHHTSIVNYFNATSYQPGNDETHWCAAFVNWVLDQAGYAGSFRADAKSFLTFGTPSNATYGAIVVVKRSLSKDAAAGTSSLKAIDPLKKQLGALSKEAAAGTSSGYHVGFFVKTADNRTRILGGNQGNAVNETGFGLGTWSVVDYRWPIIKKKSK